MHVARMTLKTHEYIPFNFTECQILIRYGSMIVSLIRVLTPDIARAHFLGKARISSLQIGYQNNVVMTTKTSQNGGQKIVISLRFIEKCGVSSSKRNNRGLLENILGR